MTTDVERLFARDYQQARALFLEAARDRGCNLESFDHPQLRGPDGATLGVDVARLGSPDARKALIVVSGTHGVEGLAGSGAQCGILRDELSAQLPADTALILVHAINPHGFAYERRVNEQNIDLNRNFIAHDGATDSEAGYALLHDAVMNWDGATAFQDEPAVVQFIREHGRAAFQSALTSGQRSHPDGLFFAGRTPCWSNGIWRAIVRAHAPVTGTLAIIDVHTGLGARGAAEPIHMAGDAGDAARIFGMSIQPLSSGTTSASQSIRGMLVSGAAEETKAVVAAIALEVGTVPLLEMLDVLRMEHWLRHQSAAPEALANRIRRRMREAFYIESASWQQAACRHVRCAVARCSRASERPQARRNSLAICASMKLGLYSLTECER